MIFLTVDKKGTVIYRFNETASTQSVTDSKIKEAA